MFSQGQIELHGIIFSQYRSKQGKPSDIVPSAEVIDLIFGQF